MSELMLWTRVPKGATLEVGITTTKGRVVADGEWVTHVMNDSESTEDWQDEELNPGPKVVKLKVPDDYAGSIHVTFPTKERSEATVTARILKSDGSPFGPPRTEVVAGKKGDNPRLVTLIIRMREQ